MPPRRPAEATDADPQDEPSYDGVPTVNVTVDTDPEPTSTPAEPLAVVSVPAITEADQNAPTDQGEGQS